MSERKEMIRKLEEKKALEDALKAIKKEDKKRVLKNIVSLIRKGLVSVWVGLVKLKDGIVYVFNVVNSFREAMNLQAEIKIRDAHTEEQTRKLRKSNSRKTVVAALLAFLIGVNIPDSDISIKKLTSSAKEKAVKTLAKEINEGEVAQTINNEASNQLQSTTIKDRSIEKSNSNEEVETYFVGKVTSKFELGTEDIDAVVEGRNGLVKYGQFSSDSSKEDYVVGFLKYMNTNDKDMYVSNFSGSDAPGTDSFNNHWKSAAEKEGAKFNNMQIEYKWNTLVKPTVDKVNSELNVDLSNTLLLQELAFSTVSQYESEKAFEIIKNSNLNANMTEIEILNAIQDEKEASLGNYTYTNKDGYDDNFRNIIKDRINSERIELSRLIGKQADIIKN